VLEKVLLDGSPCSSARRVCCWCGGRPDWTIACFLTVSESDLPSLSISFGRGREDHRVFLSNGERTVRTERCYASTDRESRVVKAPFSLERVSALEGGEERLHAPFAGDSRALDHVDAWAHGAGDLSGILIPFGEKRPRYTSMENTP
jgi:hypothetical protein